MLSGILRWIGKKVKDWLCIIDIFVARLVDVQQATRMRRRGRIWENKFARAFQARF